jgi:predicted 3-demethylubiquinone-9 3-methyltransferase (glyoxalase superfamily)
VSDLLAARPGVTATLMPTLRTITPCLWFDGQAEAAVAFYTAIFPRSKTLATSRYTKAGHAIHGQPAGAVMTIAFELDGQTFTALNGGPHFKFNEAISLQVICKNQDEVDHYWKRLAHGGDPRAQQCGWLKDRFGVSWQVVPERVMTIFADNGSAGAERAMVALLQMKKLDIAALERAYSG